MKSFFDFLKLVHDMVSITCFYIGAFLIFVMTMSIAYEVMVRYLFSRPTVWALDFSEYILVYCTFLAAPWILKKNGHTGVTLLTDSLPEKKRHFLSVFTSMIGLMICAVLVYAGTIDTWDALTRNTLIIRPIVVPKFMILWIIPFGFFLLFWYFVRSMCESWRLLKHNS